MKYKQLLTYIFLLIFLTSQMAFAKRQPVANPQLLNVGAGVTALGETNPALSEELQNLAINPASISNLGKIQFSISHKKLFGLQETTLINTCFPLDNTDYMVGISFGSTMLGGIPETTYENGRIWPIGYFSSGFQTFQGSIATLLYDVSGFEELALGTNVKVYQQIVKNESRFAFGLDFGAITSSKTGLPYFEKINFGASLLNLYATQLAWSDKDKADFEKKLFLGLNLKSNDNIFQILLNNNNSNIMLGMELALPSNLYIRTSSRLNNLKRLNIGTGLKIDSFIGFDNKSYGMQIDYSYSQYEYPMDADPTNLFTLTFLGDVALVSPKIINPEKNFTARGNSITLKGVGPKNEKILIYNNNFLKKTVFANKSGKWQVNNFPLKEGKNIVYIKAFSLEKDASEKSNELTIISDNTPPSVNIIIYPTEDKIMVELTSNEPLSEINAFIDNSVISFEQVKPELWQAQFSYPLDLKQNFDQFKYLNLIVKDKAGNESQNIKEPFFIWLKTPLNNSTYYANQIIFSGVASQMIKELYINDNRINFSNALNFMEYFSLQYGRNNFILKIKTLNGQFLENKISILRLKTFSDIKDAKERKNIEYLTTLDILFTKKDGLFYPYEQISRSEIAKFIVILLNLPLDKNISNDLTDVIPEDAASLYIQSAINSGILYSYPDGTFKPEQVLTVNDLLNVFAEAGLLPRNFIYNDTNLATRQDLAKILAICPRFQQKIKELINP